MPGAFPVHSSRPSRMNPQPSGLLNSYGWRGDKSNPINARRIPDKLVLRFLKRKIQARFPTCGNCAQQSVRRCWFARTRRARHQHAAATKDALPAKHLVQIRYADRNSFARSVVFHSRRGDRDDRNPIFINQKRKFVLSHVLNHGISRHATAASRLVPVTR